MGEFSLSKLLVKGLIEAVLRRLVLVVTPSLICPRDSTLILWGSTSVVEMWSLYRSFLTTWK